MIYGRDTCQHPKSTVPEAFSQFSERLVKIRMATCLKKKNGKNTCQVLRSAVLEAFRQIIRRTCVTQSGHM